MGAPIDPAADQDRAAEGAPPSEAAAVLLAEHATDAAFEADCKARLNA